MENAATHYESIDEPDITPSQSLPVQDIPQEIPQPQLQEQQFDLIEDFDVKIGVASLVDQIHREKVLKGFDFNLMVVGDSGLGKSTFINMLFKTNIYQPEPYPEHNPNVTDSLRELSLENNANTEAPSPLKFTTFTLNESGVTLRIQIIDITNFSSQANFGKNFPIVSKFINDRLIQYLEYENGPSVRDGSQFRDPLIHCCLYFLPPNGHGLNLLDLEFMKILHNRVNLVPLIARSDTLTEPELKMFKKRVMTTLMQNNINIYNFPKIELLNGMKMSSFDPSERSSYTEDDINNMKSAESMDSAYATASDMSAFEAPFAIVGSNTTVKMANGKNVVGRKYHWGVLDVNDPKNSDYPVFKNMFIKTHFMHMVETTHYVLYERFRKRIFKGEQDPSEGGQQRDSAKERGSAEEKLNFAKKTFTEELNNERGKWEHKLRKLKDTYEKQLEELNPSAAGTNALSKKSSKMRISAGQGSHHTPSPTNASAAQPEPIYSGTVKSQEKSSTKGSTHVSTRKSAAGLEPAAKKERVKTSPNPKEKEKEKEKKKSSKKKEEDGAKRK